MKNFKQMSQQEMQQTSGGFFWFIINALILVVGSAIGLHYTIGNGRPK